MRPALLAPATFVLLAFASACPSSSPAPARDRPAAAATDGPRFDIAIESQPRATSGDEHTVRVSIEPRAPWHINLDVAPRLRLEDRSGLAGEPPRSETARFDADGLAVVHRFTPQGKGTRRLAGELKFAVCGDDTCAPESVPLDVSVEVGCDTDAVC